MITKEEQEHILDSVINGWGGGYPIRYRIFKSDQVMDIANKVAIEDISLEDKIVRMDQVSMEHGFSGIKEVLNFRSQHEHLLRPPLEETSPDPQSASTEDPKPHDLP